MTAPTSLGSVSVPAMVMTATSGVESAPWRLEEYPYTRDLLALESFHTAASLAGNRVGGFLPTEEWEPYLSSMPDRALADFLCRGMLLGFQVGFS